MTPAELKKKRIGVLKGGLSAERDVSLRSGAAVGKALSEAGYDVVEIDVGKDIAARLSAEKIDIAFIALHGRYGEDGVIQGLLEAMFIPYTGSGVMASAVGMDKVVTKQLLEAHDIPTPKSFTFASAADALKAQSDISYPVVVKPSREGSSVGVTLVKTAAEYRPAIEAAAKSPGAIMVEQYVKGKEVQGAVLDDEAIGVIEIVPAREFYDYEAKYGAGSGTQYIFPARLEPAQYERVGQLCLKAHRALRCSGASRSDAIVTPSGDIYLLEVNTLPGMTATSLLPKIAAGKGLTFTALCERLLLSAGLHA